MAKAIGAVSIRVLRNFCIVAVVCMGVAVVCVGASDSDLCGSSGSDLCGSGGSDFQWCYPAYMYEYMGRVVCRVCGHNGSVGPSLSAQSNCARAVKSVVRVVRTFET